MDPLQQIIEKIEAEIARLDGRGCEYVYGLLGGLRMALNIVQLELDKKGDENEDR